MRKKSSSIGLRLACAVDRQGLATSTNEHCRFALVGTSRSGTPFVLVLKAAERWRSSCLVSDGTGFTENLLWPLERFKQVEQCYPHRMEESEGDFIQKLEFHAPAAAQIHLERMRYSGSINGVPFCCPVPWLSSCPEDVE